MNSSQYINQALFPNNQIININKPYNIAQSTIKIILPNNSIGSGFFLKFERNNKLFYCLMTNQHVIDPEIVKMKKEITIYYNNEKKFLKIKLDKEDRIIICFKEILNIDVTLVEIIPKDQVDNYYFLTPKTNYSLQNIIGETIQIIQYPLGGYLSYSKGVIMEIYSDNKYYFYHNASTQPGSSGSPIVFNKEDKVFAIHKGTNKNKTYNIGIFIAGIIERMKDYKKNGKYKEYYKNGNLKYEGNFKDDEYNDENGQFIFENGETYIGQFQNGKKNGKSFLLNEKSQIIKNCEHKNDIEIIKEENSNNKIDNKSKQNFEKKWKESEKKKEEKENNSQHNGFNNFGFDIEFNEIDHRNLNFGRGSPITDNVSLFPLLKDMGGECQACKHDLKSHEEFTIGHRFYINCFRCEESPENSNICVLNQK